MRISAIALMVGLGACATAAPQQDAVGPWPFPVERGSALPPPQEAARNGAPPEGGASGGVDFGQWRSADPVAYAASFQNQMRARYGALPRAEARADLERNGFVCSESGRLDCRIEIMERQCAYDWYVVVEANRAQPVAGFDQMCLGAERG